MSHPSVLMTRDGMVVVEGPTETIFERPREACTRALMAAAFEVEAVEMEAADR